MSRTQTDDADASPQWRLTMWTMVAVMLTMSISFNFLNPVMPLFLPALGVATDSAVNFWAGAIASVTSFVAVFTSPIWGRMADRYGRKLMVLRSSFAIGVCTMLMGLAQTPWHMLGLRALMGAFAGFSSASVVMVASQVPERRLGYALGLLSTGQLVGSLIGPVIGGGVADLSGSYRLPFFVAGSISIAAFGLCWWLVPERFTRPAATKERASVWQSMRLMAASGGLGALVLVLLLTQFAVQAIGPMITLYVQELLGPRPDLATLGGFAFSVTGLAGVMAVPLLGRVTDRIGERRVLLIALTGAALMTLPQAFTQNYWLFVAERFGVGLFVGSILPAANALIGRITPASERGAVYGMSGSAYFLGNSLGPLTGGVVAATFGLHWVFLITAVLLFLNLAWVFFAVPDHRASTAPTEEN
jgi:MFS transporter, DHA1 family, multidrug resistance protein